MSLPSEKYTSGQYLENNPTWDIEDSSWKAELVYNLLERHGVKPDDLVEVGCGAAGVLAALRSRYPKSRLEGYDIASDAAKLWTAQEKHNLKLTVGDFLNENTRRYDVLLLLDVLEHLIDPFSFLKALHGRADYYIFHFPLDLSAFSVLRETPLLYARHKVGHIHYFTKNLAITFLDECGFNVIESAYSGSAFSSPQKSWRTKLAMLPRYLAYKINQDFGVRLFGGETLLLIAESRQGR